MQTFISFGLLLVMNIIIIYSLKKSNKELLKSIYANILTSLIGGSCEGKAEHSDAKQMYGGQNENNKTQRRQRNERQP